MPETFRPRFVDTEATYSVARQHECDQFWCRHWCHGFEQEFTAVPFYFQECKVCFALVRNSTTLDAHMEFHWNQGWRPQ